MGGGGGGGGGAVEPSSYTRASNIQKWRDRSSKDGICCVHFLFFLFIFTRRGIKEAEMKVPFTRVGAGVGVGGGGGGGV